MERLKNTSPDDEKILTGNEVVYGFKLNFGIEETPSLGTYVHIGCEGGSEGNAG